MPLSGRFPSYVLISVFVNVMLCCYLSTVLCFDVFQYWWRSAHFIGKRANIDQLLNTSRITHAMHIPMYFNVRGKPSVKGLIFNYHKPLRGYSHFPAIFQQGLHINTSQLLFWWQLMWRYSLLLKKCLFVRYRNKKTGSIVAAREGVWSLFRWYPFELHF